MIHKVVSGFEIVPKQSVGIINVELSGVVAGE